MTLAIQVTSKISEKLKLKTFILVQKSFEICTNRLSEFMKKSYEKQCINFKNVCTKTNLSFNSVFHELFPVPLNSAEGRKAIPGQDPSSGKLTKGWGLLGRFPSQLVVRAGWWRRACRNCHGGWSISGVMLGKERGLLKDAEGRGWPGAGDLEGGSERGSLRSSCRRPQGTSCARWPLWRGNQILRNH